MQMYTFSIFFPSKRSPVSKRSRPARPRGQWGTRGHTQCSLGVGACGIRARCIVVVWPSWPFPQMGHSLPAVCLFVFPQFVPLLLSAFASRRLGNVWGFDAFYAELIRQYLCSMDIGGVGVGASCVLSVLLLYPHAAASDSNPPGGCSHLRGACGVPGTIPVLALPKRTGPRRTTKHTQQTK